LIAERVWEDARTAAVPVPRSTRNRGTERRASGTVRMPLNVGRKSEKRKPDDKSENVLQPRDERG